MFKGEMGGELARINNNYSTHLGFNRAIANLLIIYEDQIEAVFAPFDTKQERFETFCGIEFDEEKFNTIKNLALEIRQEK